MSGRTTGSRLRRIGVCIALPIAFAMVSVQAADAMTFHPMNATDLFNDVNTANATPGFNVIVLSDPPGAYLPSSTQSMVITGNLEITGPPQIQPSQFPNGQQPEINAQNEVVSNQPVFTIPSGANVIFKAFDLEVGGGVGFPAVSVTGGNLELDNGSFSGNLADGLDLHSGNVTLNNFTFDNNNNGGVSGGAINQTGGNLTLNNATFAQNHSGGVESTVGFTSHNTVWWDNSPACEGVGSTSDDNSEDDDLTCNVTFGGGNPALNQTALNGGPTESNTPSASSDVIGLGDPAWCPKKTDQRFFAIPAGQTSCDLGAVQTAATLQSDTAGPTCHVDSINESTNPSVPSTEQVSATDSGLAGEGSDTVGDTSIVLKSNPAVTNGTVAYPTVPGTLFDETSPGSNVLDAPSSSPFPVTASKPAGDLTANDTSWSFTATDWFGNQTLCQ